MEDTLISKDNILPGKDHSMDALRLLACGMVLLIHIAMEGWYGLSPRSYDWTVLNFYDTIGRPGVPLFFMISGSLMLRKANIDIKKLWKKNILRLFILYILGVVFYAVMNQGIHKVLQNPVLIWNEVTGPTPQYHLWFLRTLMNLYAVTPLLWHLVRALDEKGKTYCVLLFLVFGVLRMTAAENPYLPKWILEQINLFIDMDFVGYTGYFLLGYFLTAPDAGKRFSGKMLRIIYIITVLAAAIINQSISIAGNTPSQALYGNFALPVMIESVCLFLLFRRYFAVHSLSKSASEFLSRLSSSTLFIYMIHPFFISRVMMYLKITPGFCNRLFSVPIFVFATFILCAGSGMLLKKIPLLRRIL